MEKMRKPNVFRFRSVSPLLGVTLLLITFSVSGFGQAIPDAGLRLLGLIPVPNWATSGAKVATYDTNSLNPVTGVWYIADGINNGITAIDTKTLSYIGTIQMPGCCAPPSVNASGVQVAPDLQKLIGTDRNTGIHIWDLRVPGAGPVANFTGNFGADEIDYDPINQRAYVGTAAAFGAPAPRRALFSVWT